MYVETIPRKMGGKNQMTLFYDRCFTQLPSGKHTKNYGTSPFFMGKLTISMAIFNSYVSHNQRVNPLNHH